jgi:excisionase family DNA binding protein
VSIISVSDTAQSAEHAGEQSAANARLPGDLEPLVRSIVREEMSQQLQALSSSDDRRNASGAAREESREVMSADDVAAYLHADRNTVYEYAGRGVIPCQYLGRRLLFHRSAIVAWLNPCKAANTRKG